MGIFRACVSGLVSDSKLTTSAIIGVKPMENRTLQLLIFGDQAITARTDFFQDLVQKN